LALSFFENFPVESFACKYSDQALSLTTNTVLNFHVILSNAAHKVYHHELAHLATELTLQQAIELALKQNQNAQKAQQDLGVNCHILWQNLENVAAPIASGSFHTQGMVIIPASQGTISRISAAQSSNLIERAADVCLKEKRPLVLVPRESPLHQIQLENMLRLSRFPSVSIIPAMIPYYIPNPTLAEMNRFLVSRILQHLGVAPQKNFYQPDISSPEMGAQ